MHVLYIHQNYPAQFGHIARALAGRKGYRCTFVSMLSPGVSGALERIQYKPAGGATAQTHYCSRTFENAVWHCDAVYRALRERPDVRPDLIVGHSGFGSTLFLKDLYPGVPVVNLFEYYYRPEDPESDMNFRHDLGWETPVANFHRARCRNAMILLDLQEASAAYTPTEYQRSVFPTQWRQRMSVIFDGVDRSFYHGHGESLRPLPSQRGVRTIAGRQVPPGTKVVSYVSRGFESMRGFDIFMKAARRILSHEPDTLFFVVGSDRVCYGGDERHIGKARSFREWVLQQESHDLSKFVFTGRLPPSELGQLLASTDVHIYLTVPFVLSWSMMDALSCGAVVVGSDTAPVREMIRHGENGLLADFFDADAIAARTVEALRDVPGHRVLGRTAEQIIVGRYSMEAVLPQMLALYDRAMSQPAQPAPPAGLRPLPGLDPAQLAATAFDDQPGLRPPAGTFGSA